MREREGWGVVRSYNGQSDALEKASGRMGWISGSGNVGLNLLGDVNKCSREGPVSGERS